MHRKTKEKSLNSFSNQLFLRNIEDETKRTEELSSFNFDIKPLLAEQIILLPENESSNFSTRVSKGKIQHIKKILIVTTWRSGSTFVGDIISSSPGVFYSYEPMYFFERHNGSKSELIRSLSQCQFTDEYLRDMNGLIEGSQNFMKMNQRVWNACQHNYSLCAQPEFVGQLCSFFPVHLMKMVRLRVKELSSLIDDSLMKEWKYIYLVRDPRGVMSSRKNMSWCEPDPACNDKARLCSDVKDDLERIGQLKNVFPNRFYLLKFEDFVASVELETEKLFSFLEMPFTDSVKLFLSQHSHSNETRDNPSSTIRHSSTVAMGWKSKLSDMDIANITNVCAPTLKMLGFL
jgi:hypothetical protein